MSTSSFTVLSTFSVTELTKDISKSNITSTLQGIAFQPTGANNLTVYFTPAISAGDLTTLTLLVANNSSYRTPREIISQYKYVVKVATTTNGTLATAYASGQTIDGVVLATGDRILIKNQTNAIENGIYMVNNSGAPTRTTDLQPGYKVAGIVVNVNQGTINAITIWTCSNIIGTAIVAVNPITFDTLSPSVGNYAFAYSTATQNAAVANTFQLVTYTTAPQLNGWSLALGTGIFTCNQTGLYIFTYQAALNTTTGAEPQTGSMTVNLSTTPATAEIPGSQSSTQTATNNVARVMTQNFLANVTSGQNVTLQFAATNTVTQLTPSTASQGVTKVSVSITIVRIS